MTNEQAMSAYKADAIKLQALFDKGPRYRPQHCIHDETVYITCDQCVDLHREITAYYRDIPLDDFSRFAAISNRYILEAIYREPQDTRPDPDA